MGDIVEAGYTGYARQAVVWGAPYQATDGLQAMNAGSLSFTPTDALKPQTVVGLILADAVTAGNLLGMLLFDTPVPLNGPNQILDVLLTFGLDALGNYGTAVMTF
jgi:hypothetical protein